MKYRAFGNTGLYVSELCLGAMTFGTNGEGAWKAIGQLGGAEAESLIGASLDAGVNLIDTADVYSAGASEQIVGAALRALGRPREQYLVATKVRGRTGPGPNELGLSRGHVLAAADDNLLELTDQDRRRVFNLGYFTWVEQQGVTFEEFTARRGQRFWRDLRSRLPLWDDMIAEFNREVAG